MNFKIRIKTNEVFEIESEDEEQAKEDAMTRYMEGVAEIMNNAEVSIE